MNGTSTQKIEGTLMDIYTNYMLPKWGSSSNTSQITSKISWLQRRLGNLLNYITIEDSNNTQQPKVTGYLCMVLDNETNDIIGINYVSNINNILQDLIKFCNYIRFNIPYPVMYKKVFVKSQNLRVERISMYSGYKILTVDEDTNTSIFSAINDRDNTSNYIPLFWINAKKPTKDNDDIYNDNGLNVNLVNSIIKE